MTSLTVARSGASSEAVTGSPLEETITLRQAKTLITCMAHEQSFLLLSPPGVGKSEMVYQAAAEAGLPCRSLLGTQIAPEDVSGIPRIVGERSVFCPPRVLLPENPEPFCLFLDELPACAPDVQKAFYSLLLERRLGEHALPAGTWVVAAGNRVQDRALVRSLSSALINRVSILNVRVDTQEWLDWAIGNGVRADVVNFISYMPDALMRPVPSEPQPFSTPRAWTLLSRGLDLAEAAGHPDARAAARARVRPGVGRRRRGVLRAGRGIDSAHAAAHALHRASGEPADRRRRTMVHPQLHSSARARRHAAGRHARHRQSFPAQPAAPNTN